jgi:hypothetical protein
MHLLLTRFCRRSTTTHPLRPHAGLAQLVEQLICNQWVGGSSPSAGTNNFNRLEPIMVRRDFAVAAALPQLTLQRLSTERLDHHN